METSIPQGGPRRLTRRQILAAARLTGLLAFPACSKAEPPTPPRGPYATREALRSSLAATGVSPADQAMLVDLALPSTALPSRAADDAEIAIGASKIGGAPDLPRAMSWPTRQPTSKGLADVRRLEEMQPKEPSEYLRREIARKAPLAARVAPLTFMLQVDLAACAAAGPLDPDMPREGRLLVFYDLVFRPWTGRDSDGNPLFKVLHVTEDAANLVRAPLPDLGYPLFGDDLPTYRDRLPPARLTPRFTFTLPDAFSVPIITRSMELPVPHQAWLDADPAHLDATNRLSGWPENIQGDMPMDLTAEEAGIELPFGQDVVTAYHRLDPRRLREWVLLLQIGNYDNKINDFDGLYYVWIKRGDLRARDFSKARLIYQTD